MIKLLRMTALLMMTAAIIVACGGGGDEPEAPITPPVTPPVETEVVLTVSPARIETPAIESTYEISVSTTSGSWSATASADWIAVAAEHTTAKEGKVKVTVSGNANAERNGSVAITAGNKTEYVAIAQAGALRASRSDMLLSSGEDNVVVTIYGADDYEAKSNSNWLTVSKSGSQLTLTAQANGQLQNRYATVTVTGASQSIGIEVGQESMSDPATDIKAPIAGYRLVWHDEFNEGTQLGTDKWEWEDWKPGNVNNELQAYRPGTQDLGGKHTTDLSDGKLNINCFKHNGSIYSGRVNAKNNGKGWQYGYFEARILLPKGKGTWPAYWMMPQHVDWTTDNWPHCGEIDIMEEVGCVPNEVSSSLHASGHNHTNNTQITHAMTISKAEGEYHLYALEWTPDYIQTYVDGEKQLYFEKKAGADEKWLDSNWPYDKPYHLILNLAWGGSWGGMYGVDDSALPITMKVDYVRVFQK